MLIDTLAEKGLSLLPLSLERRMRERFDRPRIGVTHSVELYCPVTDEQFGTERTEAVDVDRDVDGGVGIWTYECSVCDGTHRFLWGPPAPICLDERGDNDAE